MAKLNIKLKVEIIIALLVIICALLGFLTNQKVDTYGFNENAIYYINDVEYRIEKGDKAYFDTKSNQMIISRSDGTKLASSGLPVYIDNSDALLLINDMTYYKPINGELKDYKLTYFTKIESLDGDEMKIEWETKKDFENIGFIYDGYDTYVVLDEVYLNYNGRTIELSPLSYIIVSRGDYVEYRDKKHNTYEIEYYNGDDITISEKQGRYSIVASFDFVNIDENMYILQSGVSKYNPYFSKEESK